MSTKFSQILTRARKYILAMAAKDWYLAAKNSTTTTLTQKCEDVGVDRSTLQAWIKGNRPIPPPMLEKLYIKTQDRRFLLTKAEKDYYRESGRSPVPNDQYWWPDLRQEEADEGVANIVVPEEFLPVRSEKPSAETVTETPEEPQSVTTAEVDLVMGMLELIIRQMSQSPSLQTAIKSAETFNAVSASLAKLLGLTTTPVVELTIAKRITSLTSELHTLADLPSSHPDRKRARNELIGPAMALFREIRTLKIEFPEAFEEFLEQLNLATSLRS